MKCTSLPVTMCLWPGRGCKICFFMTRGVGQATNPVSHSSTTRKPWISKMTRFPPQTWALRHTGRLTTMEIDKTRPVHDSSLLTGAIPLTRSTNWEVKLVSLSNI